MPANGDRSAPPFSVSIQSGKALDQSAADRGIGTSNCRRTRFLAASRRADISNHIFLTTIFRLTFSSKRTSVALFMNMY